MVWKDNFIALNCSVGCININFISYFLYQNVIKCCAFCRTVCDSKFHSTIQVNIFCTPVQQLRNKLFSFHLYLKISRLGLDSSLSWCYFRYSLPDLSSLLLPSSPCTNTARPPLKNYLVFKDLLKEAAAVKTHCFSLCQIYWNQMVVIVILCLCTDYGFPLCVFFCSFFKYRK